MAVGPRFGWFTVLAAAATLPLTLWWSTTERHTSRAARVVAAVGKPTDLVLLARVSADLGGLIRPFGPQAVAVVDPAGALPDLTTFPEDRVWVWGPGMEGLRAGLMDLTDHGEQLWSGRPARAGTHVAPLLGSGVLRVALLGPDGQVRGCDRRHAGGGVVCGQQPWQYVGPTVLTARGRMVACLWAHPVRDHVMVFRAPLKRGGRADLWLQYADEALADPPHVPVTVATLLNGESVGTVECVNRDSGRCPFSLTAPEGDAAAPVMAEWRVSTADAARQIICLGGAVEVP